MALDFSDWCGFNFRQTNGTNFTADGTNEFGLTGAPQTTLYPTDPDKGWSLGPNGSNSSRAIDRRIYGHAAASSNGNIFNILAPNGDYFLRLVMGHCTVDNAQTACIVVDSLNAGLIGDGIFAILGTSGSAQVNKHYVTNDQQRVYKCTLAGTYATGNPTGTTGTITDGTGAGRAQFTFAGNVVHIYDTGAVTKPLKTQVVDIDATLGGTIVSESTWASSGPQQKTITIANGGLSVFRHPASVNNLRHIALKADTTPLQDVELRDETGASMGSNPSLHAGQPTGKLLCQLYFATGSVANLSLAGSLASYFQIVTHGADKWLASLLPMPDGTTGDLQIIQTDSSTFISGSPYTTTFDTEADTLTIVSSESKPTQTSGVSGNALAYALISTPNWLNHKTVRETVEAAYDGFSDQTIAHEYFVANETDLGNAITSANAAVGVGVWQAITITGGSYGNRTWTTANYSQGGTGGLLIRATGDHAITGSWQDNGGWRGVHFLGLNFDPGAIGTFSTGIVGNGSASMNHEVVVSGCDLGTDGNTGYSALRFFTGKSVKIRNNTFRGFQNGIDVFGVRCVEVGNNDFTQFTADLVGASVFNEVVALGKGVLADNHCYLWKHDNKGHDCQDDWGGYITDNNPHCDGLQIRETVIGWVTGTVYAAGSWVTSNDRFYRTAAGGTAGASAPSHTNGGDASDGAVTWTDMGSLDGCRLHLSIHGNRYTATSTTYSDIAAEDTSQGTNGVFIAGLIGFFIDSSRGLRSTASVFNNICGSRSVLSGWSQQGGAVNPHHVEYNTFAAPPMVPDADEATLVSEQNVLNDTAISGSGCFARKNIVGTVGTVALNEDNLLVSWRPTAPDPALKLRGPTSQNSVNDIWGYDTFDETLGADAYALSLERFLAPLPANAGYGAQSSQAAATGARSNRPLNLGLGLGC